MQPPTLPFDALLPTSPPPLESACAVVGAFITSADSAFAASFDNAGLSLTQQDTFVIRPVCHTLGRPPAESAPGMQPPTPTTPSAISPTATPLDNAGLPTASSRGRPPAEPESALKPESVELLLSVSPSLGDVIKALRPLHVHAWERLDALGVPS